MSQRDRGEPHLNSQTPAVNRIILSNSFAGGKIYRAQRCGYVIKLNTDQL